MKTEKKNKPALRVAVALGVGFAVAMLYMAVCIYFGYQQAYGTEAAAWPVKAFGLVIYQLTQSGEGYAATAMGPNMGIVCGICMVLAVLVVEIVHRLRRGKKR